MSNKLFIIGINDYSHQDKLSSSVKDVQDIRDILLDKYNFEKKDIYELYDNDATNKKIQDGFRGSLNQLKENDNLIVMFSGHGGFLEDQKRGFWIPIDGTKDYTTWIPNETILTILNQCKCKHIVVIADSCFSNSILLNQSKSIQEYIDHSSRWALTSAFSHSFDGSSEENSLFAECIIDFLKEQQSNFRISKLIEYVKNRYERNLRQTPQGAPLDLHGHKGGEFVFTLKNNSSNTVSSQKENTLQEVEEVKVYNEFGIKEKDGDVIIRIAPTAFFSNRISKAFPGVRDIFWYEGQAGIDGLKRFFKNPISFNKADGYGTYSDPIWWFRGSSALPIDSFKDLGNGKILLGHEELKINKIAVFHAQSYFRSFIYVETYPDECSGVYKYSEEEIKNHIDSFGYYNEEFGIHKGIPIKREEYDDGAAIINGEYVELEEFNLRIRYLSKYNFIIVAKSSPHNSTEGNILGDYYMNAILKGEKTVEEYIIEAQKLSKNSMDS